MKVLICHERFLFRFGADRALILLGKGLKELGHEIIFMGNRFDHAILNSFADRLIQTPTDLGPYLDLNELTLEWLSNHWSEFFSLNSGPDAVVVGGWPFIAAIPFFRDVSPQVAFMDFGVVPVTGYADGVRITLEKLHALRRQHLSAASVILPISDFLSQTQSKSDSNGKIPVRPILLGADHMESSLWHASQLHERSTKNALNTLASLNGRGTQTILCLGRWEPGCYKNSDAAFEIIRALVRHFPQSALLILEDERNVAVPSDLIGHIMPIGFPDDSGLVAIMQNIDLGISMSLWEGFNLPLAEMQWFGRPALAFDLGAHPEVVAHPCYLCRDANEMAEKAAMILRGQDLTASERHDALDRFRSYFRWERLTRDYLHVFQDTAGFAPSPHTLKHAPTRASLVMDVSNSARDPANSGVIRVTRRLAATLQKNTDPLFAVWDDHRAEYVLPTVAEAEQLAAFHGPRIHDASRLSGGPDQRVTLDTFLATSRKNVSWLLIPEVKSEESFRNIRQYARMHQWQIGALFYDAIPVLRPDLCSTEIRNHHHLYMEGLAECDVVVPISVFSANCLRDFWQEAGIVSRSRLVANLLPGDFTRDTKPRPESPETQIRILCVSTLEPRKNHRKLVAACLRLQDEHPELDWSLTLVGNRYAGAFDVAEFIEQIQENNPRIKWLGVVDDAKLCELYQGSSFTVYPSVIEGFGLPILESLFHERPCICSDTGVMAELARDGGCLTTSVEDVSALSAALHRLATDHAYRRRLSTEARARKIKTWDEYSTDFLRLLGEYNIGERASAVAVQNHDSHAWQKILYAGCLYDNWQMHDSERLALAGLLARHSPKCSIEVGTYCAGSLSLISQYSDVVFSIDIDPTIPERFRQFENVTFVTGDSGLILKYLLQELDAVGSPAEFILIDGDHSGHGIKRDVAALLPYVPQKPLFVLFHDSFNPGCRRGLLEADLEQSQYCHFLDVDFVPGRVIEHGGPTAGELWGGLALAYFSPSRRNGRLTVQRSAASMFEIVSGRVDQRQGAPKP